MKNLWLSLVTIIMVLGGVTGAAYALFNDSVEIQGITISTGTVDLKINGMDGIFSYNGEAISNLLPGDTKPGIVPFRLTNEGTANIDMGLRAKMTGIPMGPDWDAFKDSVSIRIRNVNHADKTSGYYKLSEWLESYKLLNSQIGFTSGEDFVMDLMVDENLDNSAAGKILNDINFEIVGEQI